MKLNNLKKPKGFKKNKRIGRGEGSGHGGTSTKGHKGQKARSGKGKNKPGFEGGQMPLARRLPKKGFHNPFKKRYAIINIEKLNLFSEKDIITPKLLLEKKIIKNIFDGVKLLGKGNIQFSANIKLNFYSHNAKIKIENAGGKIEEI